MTDKLIIQLDATSDLLRSWDKARTELGERTAQGPLASVLDSFPIADSRQVRETLRGAVQRGVKLEVDAGGYVRGPAVTRASPMLWPVATVWAEPSAHLGIEMQLRLATFFEHDGELHACGWRFETGEDPDVEPPHPHPYAHVQQISSLDGAGARTFLTPPRQRAGIEVHQAHVNETRPSFPIRGSSGTGLAIAMLAALYGAPMAREIIGLSSPQRVAMYREEITLVLG